MLCLVLLNFSPQSLNNRTRWCAGHTQSGHFVIRACQGFLFFISYFFHCTIGRDDSLGSFRNPSMPRIFIFYFFHCTIGRDDSLLLVREQQNDNDSQSTDTNPTTQMEVGWGGGNLSSAGVHTRFVSVQASHARFELSGVTSGPNSLSRGAPSDRGICCRYVLNSSTYSFGQMTMRWWWVVGASLTITIDHSWGVWWPGR